MPDLPPIHGNETTRLAVLEANMNAERRLMTEALKGRDEAIKVALSSMNSHLGQMNEFRGAMQDQAAKFITRDEHALLLNQITQLQISAKSIPAEYVSRRDMDQTIVRIETMEKSQANMQGRYAIIAVIFSAAVALGGTFWSITHGRSVEQPVAISTSNMETLIALMKARIDQETNHK